MKVRTAAILAAAVILLGALPLPLLGGDAAAPSRGGFSLQLLPGYDIPFVFADVLRPGFGGSVNADYRMPFLPLLFARAGFAYDHSATADVPVLDIVGAYLGVGAWFDPVRWLSLKVFLTGGYSDGFLRGLSSTPTFLEGGSMSGTLGVQGLFNVLGPLSVVTSVEALYYHQLYMGMRGSVGAAFNFGAVAARPRPALPGKPAAEKPAPTPAPEKLEQQPVAGKGLRLAAACSNIFPVFQTWYDSHPLGTLTVTNGEDADITDVAVSFYLRQYMDGPKSCGRIARIEKGARAQFDLTALFTNRILEITEGTKSLAEITVEYSKGGKAFSARQADTVRLFDRNSMTWADDRGAASFVTARDPAVLSFSNNVVGMIKGKVTTMTSPKLLQAMAIHEELDLFGMNYVVDPQSSYATAIQVRDSVDYLKFPRQTLEYRGGDCDDLSILYCALLESVGIETAFITTPGHIFAALALDMSVDQARKAFQRPDELILREGKAWLPVEVTERGTGFMAAWQAGAREWRENLARNQAALLPIHDAWKVFEPVGLPGAAPALAVPPQSALLPRFLAEHEKFVSREIFAQEAKLQADIKRQESPKAVNQLGVLYARYGLFEKAEREFQRILAKAEYVPALLNLGNLSNARNDPAKALQFYERAYRKDPKNGYVLLALARVNHAMENYGQVKQMYGQLKTVDPDLASQYAYLDLRGEEATRAADLSGVKERIEWVSE